VKLFPPTGNPERALIMEIAIAWLTMAALILLVLGIIDPGTALFWSKGVKTRKRAAMIYGFVFFATVALSIVFFPRTNLESKLYTLLAFGVIALAAGYVNPQLVLPWRRDATRRAVALFYLPPIALIAGAIFYTGMTTQVDPRYDLRPEELSSASEPELIKYRAAEALDGDNNLGMARIRNIELSEAADGGYDVVVEYNMDDVVFVSFFKIKAEEDMTKVYKALYSGDFDLNKVTVTGYFPVGDRDRKNPSVPVWTTTLDKAQAEGVDWSKSDYELAGEVLPKLWKTEYMHPDYK